MMTQNSSIRWAAALAASAALALPLGPAFADEPENPGATSLLDRLNSRRQAEAQEEAADGESSVALIDIDGAIDEKGSSGGLGSAASQSLRELMISLRDYSEDEDIKAIVVRINSYGGSMSAMQELHGALLEARAAKPVHAFLTGGNKGELYLASACDTITMPPTATLWLNGMAIDAMFYKRLLDNLGIEMQVLKMGKYKSAMESFSREDFSEPARESYQALIDTIFEELAKGLAEGRGFSVEEAEKFIAHPPMDAEQSKEAGLIDFVRNEPQFYDWLQDEELGGDDIAWEVSSGEENPFENDNPFQVWMSLMGGKTAEKEIPENSIALVYLSGGIVDGGIEDAAYEDGYIAAFPVVNLLEEIRQEDNIAAVVLRVDSPGGSAYASDRIWNAVKRLKEEKPVVVSMAGVAASGGYYVSMPSDYIFANPMTITGSIGVIGGKPVLKQLYDTVGLDIDTVERGRSMKLMTVHEPWNTQEQEFMTNFMQDTYKDFVTKAAEGRHQEYKDIHKVAQGRVWSGRDALEIGLVDELGGLFKAIDKAKELSGLAISERYPLEVYPRKLTFAEVLERAFGGLNSGPGVAMRASFSQKVAAAFSPLVLELLPPDAIDHVGLIYTLLKEDGVALAMPVSINVR